MSSQAHFSSGARIVTQTSRGQRARRHTPSILWLLLVLLGIAPGVEAGDGGHLFIIGGGRRDELVMKEFISLAGGGDRAVIAVLPMASSIPETTGMDQVGQLRSLGVRDARMVLLTRDQALDPAGVAALDGVTGVFFSGGDQSRLTAALLGTPVHRRLLELYRQGIVIGGTSAGAAVMSRLMITGNELLNPDSSNPFTAVRRGNIELKEGFGFLGTAIVDQHFIRRRRHNRLFSVVLEHPSLLGLGIDEATAVVVNPDSTFSVVGDGSVLVIDASAHSSIRTDARGNLGGTDMRVHVLLNGDRFDMRRHQLLISEKEH